MPRRPAKVTQANIARAIRAAKNAGATAVTVDGHGIIRIALNAAPAEPTAAIEPAKDESESWTPSEALKRHLNSAESG